ncbi:Homeobox domain-containing protein [Aphelenchoides besseyi]|nr:Homeobox domain-containing protein [Aphelenchoides besseyi]KAI6193316.1 Homeobox domain-containing protein [Aphelenchoides besseyi]
MQLDNKTQSIDNLLGQLTLISDETFPDEETSAAIKDRLLSHPLKNALFVVLYDYKTRIALSTRNSIETEENNAQLMRLDNMLIAEEVVAPDGSMRQMPENYMADQPEYREKLLEIRESYANSMNVYSSDLNTFNHHVAVLLRQQQNVRPITQQEIQRMLEIIQRKWSRFQIQLKQTTCENLVNLRHRLLDQRRKRRNHSKKATEVLNHYFQTHISNPYPSEEDKLELARQCQITVNQVSNWFGNRRIRYKKSRMKQQQQSHPYVPAAQNPLSTPNPYAVLPDLYSSIGLHNSNSPYAYNF